jgi:hypothetical protein
VVTEAAETVHSFREQTAPYLVKTSADEMPVKPDSRQELLPAAWMRDRANR